MDNIKAARISVYIGRVVFIFSLLALLGAWITQLTDGRILGMKKRAI